jgi:hypothetical protein
VNRKGITPLLVGVLILFLIVLGAGLFYYKGMNTVVTNTTSQGWQGSIHAIYAPCEPFFGTPPTTGLGPYCGFSFGGAAYQLTVPTDPAQEYMLNFAYGCPPSGSCGPARKMPYENELVQVTGKLRFDAGVKLYVIDVTSWTPVSSSSSTLYSQGIIAGYTWSYGCPATQNGTACGSPYPNFPVAIYNSDTGQMVTTVTSDNSGEFQVNVVPGTYAVYSKVLGPSTPGNFGGNCTYPPTYNLTWIGCASTPYSLSVSAGSVETATVLIPNGLE